MDFSVYAPAATIIVGILGILFAALKFNREDAGKVVSQQSEILKDMKLLNEQLHIDLTRAIEERDRIITERDSLRLRASERDARIEQLTGEIAALQHKIHELEGLIGETA